MRPEDTVMTTSATETTGKTVGQRGGEVYDRLVRPKLRPEDTDKYVAIDVETGDFEVDWDDYTANMKLLARCPADRIWLERVGHAAAYKIRIVSRPT
jgi:hypothetical protein